MDTALDVSARTGPVAATDPVLEVENLRTYLFTRWGTTRAVDGVSFEVHPGETVGIVGESGSGKTMLGLSLVRLTPEPVARFVSGSIRVAGQDVLALSERQMRRVRGRDISMIFQDPQQSLNPVFTVGDQLREAIRTQDRTLGRGELDERAIEALRSVNVPDPVRRLRNYPHELSGGMKQRIVSAMAMVGQPKILVADEPTTALDVTIQAQFLRLLREMQERTNVAILLVTHDFGVVAQSCDRVAVMYAGRILEMGPVEEIFDRPRHPYTRALLEARPRPGGSGRLPSIEGAPPSLVDPPHGCRFAPRCRYVLPDCEQAYPPTVSVDTDHVAACFRSEEEPWLSPS